LRPLEEYHNEQAAVIAGPVEESPNTGGEGNDNDAKGTDFSDEDNNNGDIGTYQHDSSTFKEAMTANIDLILNMAASLKHQIQFQDQWLLNTLQQEGAGFLRFAKTCIEKERRVNSTRSPPVLMWEKSTSSTMFYHTRPTIAK
jgi:hypothetical protein